MLALFQRMMGDASMNDFFNELHTRILAESVPNSYWEFKYSRLGQKTELFKALETYQNDGTVFYSAFMVKHPDVNIKRIGEIRIGHNVYFKGRCAYPDGTCCVRFTVYFEKKKTIPT